jgi:hypothetical protein
LTWIYLDAWIEPAIKWAWLDLRLCALDKHSTADFAVQELAFGIEDQLHFDTLKTQTALTHQCFSTEVDRLAACGIFDAQIVIQVDASADEIAAAVAFNCDPIGGIIRACRGGKQVAEV